MINNAIYAAAVGSSIATDRMDVLANNLANVATPGYKGDRTGIRASEANISSADFDRFRTMMKQAGSVVAVSTSQTQGAIQVTNRNLDLAIQGEGYFELGGPNGSVYTRNGVFRVDSEGFLTGSKGYPVLGEGGPIQVEGGNFTVHADGTIDVDGQEVDRLHVVTFEDKNQLTKAAGTVFEKASEEVAVVEAEDFQIIQGSLEMSNVNAVRAMAELIDTQRLYDSSMQNMRMINQMNEKMVTNISRTK